MRRAISRAKELGCTGKSANETDAPDIKVISSADAPSYYLLVNDDVEFFPGSIEEMIREHHRMIAEATVGAENNGIKGAAGAESARMGSGEIDVAGADRDRKQDKPLTGHIAMVGPMCDDDGNFSYGGIRYTKGIHYEEVRPDDKDRHCDSFNMNCLLIDRETFLKTPNFDSHYIHSLADFDYGLAMKRMGVAIYVADKYVGRCPDNDPKGGWSDVTLSRRERLRAKESIKGAPFKPWFYFLWKNFGPGAAVVHGFTPYIRIILGR
jgi:GT2 family glycosyltransferase